MTKKLKPNTKRQKYTKKSKPSFVAPLIILIVIIVLIITIVTFTLSLLFHNPEKTIKDQLSALSKDYYENHLYESLTAAQESTDSVSFNKTMEKYQKYGFGTVHLRQMLSYDKQTNPSRVELIAKYCDENKTYAKFYPEPPFNRDSFRVEFTYSCNF